MYMSKLHAVYSKESLIKEVHLETCKKPDATFTRKRRACTKALMHVNGAKIWVSGLQQVECCLSLPTPTRKGCEVQVRMQFLNIWVITNIYINKDNRVSSSAH